MTRRMKIIFIWFLLSSLICAGQSDYTFRPLKTKSDKAVEIKKALQKSMLAELNNTPKEVRETIRAKYQESVDQISKGIDKRVFIWSDTLTSLIENVMNSLIKQNSLRHIVPMVLIYNSPEANALCLSNGTIIITIGLLARLTSEDQLAFILGHELEHHQLLHLRMRIYNEEKKGDLKKLKSTVKGIMKGNEPVEEIEELRASFYNAAQFSQQHELSADSASIVIIQNSHYQDHAALEVLDLLDIGYCTDTLYSKTLFDPLDAPRFPFQEEWINHDFKAEGKDRTNVLFFNADSLRSHPEMEARKNAMMKQLQEQQKSTLKSLPIVSITRIAAFQNVKTSFDLGLFDLSLYHALNLMQFERSDFLVEYVGRVLAEAAELKQNPIYRSQFYKPTYSYCQSLRLVSNLLRNITSEQASEMLYQFMNRSQNFNSDNEFHYYLMWKACQLTARESTSEKVRAQYISKFPRGEFRFQMR
jgi:hypothetical protein